MKFLLFLILCASEITTAHSQTIVINNTRTAAHVSLPRNKLSLIAPLNYVPLPDDAGFFLKGSDPEKGNEQIRVSKFFLDFPTVKQSLLSAGATHKDVLINNYEGVWIISKETVDGEVFTSLTLGFGNASYSYVIIGAYPSQNASIDAKLQKAIHSAYVDTFGYSSNQSKMTNTVKREKAKQSFTAKFDSKFKVDISGTGFMPAEIISDNHIIYTHDGAYPPVAADKSQLEIKYGSATVSEASYNTYSTQILAVNPAFNSSSVIENNTAGIDGLNGIELVANANYGTGSQPIKVYQLTLFTVEGVFTLTGIAYENTQTMIDTFKKIAKTFTRIP